MTTRTPPTLTAQGAIAMQVLSRVRRLVLMSSLVVGVAWLAQATAGDEPRKAESQPKTEARPEVAAKPKLPPYPRVNLATVYVADPSWPRKPGEIRWGAMPGLAIDARDRVYLHTRALPPVQVYDADGTFLKGWGEDLVKDPHHIRVDPRGNVWLADTGHHVVMQCTPDGTLLRTLGTKGEPGEDESHFNLPTDMAVTPEGEVFVSDGYGNSRIVHYDRDGKFVKAWGKLGIRPGEFSNPHAIALDSRGRLYVADRSNGRVQVFDQDGRFLDEWRNLVIPWGLWITPDDEVWVCGSTPMPWRESDVILGNPPHDQVFMRFDTSGKVLQVWRVPLGEEGHHRPGECNWVHAMALDSKGNIYAGDIKGERAQKFVKQVGSPALGASGRAQSL